jgi:hypothetical protein
VGINGESDNGGTIEVRLDKVDGPLLAKSKMVKSADWRLQKAKLLKKLSGKHDLFIILKGANAVSVDWIRFY